MDDSDPIPVGEWTEYRPRRGLDPLGMQTSSIRLYQTLVPGISNITSRLRYYALYPWLSRTYAQRVGDTDPSEWRRFVRRAEALYVLVACRAGSGAGVAGIKWAQRTLEVAGTDAIEYADGAESESGAGYLKRAAFDAAYRTQLFETGILQSSSDHAIPLPSPFGEELAGAFEGALGAVAGQLYDVIQRRTVTVDELDCAADAVPSAVPVGGPEPTLYQRLLLAENDHRSRTVTLLLAVARLLEREPKADEFRWILYAGCDRMGQPLILNDGMGGHPAAALRAHRDQWWIYQANDLCHVAYEALLKYTLDVLGSYPAGVSLERLMGRCASEIAAALDAAPTSWARLVDSIRPTTNAYGPDDAASDFRLAALAMRAGRDACRVCGTEHAVAAVRLLATLDWRLRHEAHDLTGALGHLGGAFRSLLTEKRFLDDRGGESLRATLFAILEQRILGRHLWVALRKLRYQGDYGFLIEADDGRVRLRERDGPVFTTPRIDPTITFLKDCHLIDADGLTGRGLAALRA